MVHIFYRVFMPIVYKCMGMSMAHTFWILMHEGWHRLYHTSCLLWVKKQSHWCYPYSWRWSTKRNENICWFAIPTLFGRHSRNLHFTHCQLGTERFRISIYIYIYIYIYWENTLFVFHCSKSKAWRKDLCDLWNWGYFNFRSFIWNRLWCQKQVYRAVMNTYIPRITVGCNNLCKASNNNMAPPRYSTTHWAAIVRWNHRKCK